MVRRGPYPAHRLCESLEPAAGARRGAKQGVRHAQRSGSRTRKTDSPIADGEPGACRAPGALLGLGFAFAITRYLAHQGSIALPLLSSARVDVTALTWTLLITVAAAVLFGLVPGLRIAGGQPSGGAQGRRPRNERGPKARAPARGAGGFGGRSGLRAADWRRLVAAQLSESPGCRPGIPAQPGCRNQSGLRRWR